MCVYLEKWPIHMGLYLQGGKGRGGGYRLVDATTCVTMDLLNIRLFDAQKPSLPVQVRCILVCTKQYLHQLCFTHQEEDKRCPPKRDGPCRGMTPHPPPGSPSASRVEETDECVDR